MLGLDEGLITHQLHVSPHFPSIQQRPRHFGENKEPAMKEEVSKLLHADFIREVQYPTWLANVVMVKKARGKWRMCADFTDLNKACPKDCYPLPMIDALVDSTAGCEMLSFLDAFFGYHQIRMSLDDQVHTYFRAAGATYCYNVMSFGLKNAGATYQRMVNLIFHE